MASEEFDPDAAFHRQLVETGVGKGELAENLGAMLQDYTRRMELGWWLEIDLKQLPTKRQWHLRDVSADGNVLFWEGDNGSLIIMNANNYEDTFLLGRAQVGTFWHLSRTGRYVMEHSFGHRRFFVYDRADGTGVVKEVYKKISDTWDAVFLSGERTVVAAIEFELIAYDLTKQKEPIHFKIPEIESSKDCRLLPCGSGLVLLTPGKMTKLTRNLEVSEVFNFKPRGVNKPLTLVQAVISPNGAALAIEYREVTRAANGFHICSTHDGEHKRFYATGVVFSLSFLSNRILCNGSTMFDIAKIEKLELRGHVELANPGKGTVYMYMDNNSLKLYEAFPMLKPKPYSFRRPGGALEWVFVREEDT